MHRNSIILFIAAFLVTSIVVGFAIIVIALLTFDLAGGETLNQIEGQDILYLVISVLFFTMAIILARPFFKKGKKSIAYGILVVPFLIVVSLTIYIVKEDFYKERFDSVTWKRTTRKPEGMAKTLVKKKKLIGLTRGQAKEMLGEGNEEYGDKTSDRGSIIYLVENDWTFMVLFKKDTVVETEMRRARLMTKNHGEQQDPCCLTSNRSRRSQR